MSEKEVSALADEDGNYDSPALQRLRAIWDDYDQGKATAQDVLQLTDKIQNYIEEQIREIEETADSLGPDNKNANRETILDGFYEHLRGLELMRLFFKEEDDSLIDEGFDLIQEATNLLMMGLQGLVEESVHEIPKLCVRCGRENSQDANSCKRCGTILPMLTEFANPSTSLLAINDSEAPETAEDETTPNFIEISDAYQNWQASQLDSHGFFDAVVKVHKIQLSDLEEITKSYRQEQSNNPDSPLAQALLQTANCLEQNIGSLESLAQAIDEERHTEVSQNFQSFAETTIELIEASKKLLAAR